MTKKAQNQFVFGALVGAAAVYFLTRQPVVVVPGPNMDFPGPVSDFPAIPQQAPEINGQFSRKASWYGVGAYPMSPQRIRRPLAPPANYFI